MTPSLRRKSKEDNLKRLNSDGRKVVVDTGLNEQLDSLITKMKVIGSVRTKKELLELIDEYPEYLCAIMAMSGISLEGLKSIQSVYKSCDARAVLEEELRIHKWDKKINGTIYREAFVFGDDSDYIIRRGIVNFACCGKQKTLGTMFAIDYPWVRSCDFHSIISIANSSDAALERIGMASLRGSHNSKKGRHAETKIGNVLDGIGLRYKLNPKLMLNERELDLLIEDNIAVEIAYPNSTGSSLSDKTKVVLSQAKKLKQYIFVFLGGGSGWANRQEDQEKLCDLDYCFGSTQEQLIEFFCFVANTFGKKISTKAIRKLMVEQELISA